MLVMLKICHLFSCLLPPKIESVYSVSVLYLHCFPLLASVLLKLSLSWVKPFWWSILQGRGLSEVMYVRSVLDIVTCDKDYVAVTILSSYICLLGLQGQTAAGR